ncbi:hypothetical protein LINPERPRIM_LOCUS35149 [Linum perenne]
MDHFDPIYTQLANEHILHTNDHFRSSSFRAIYNQFYLDRTIIPTIRLNPIDFVRYGLHPDCLIANLGWSSLVLPRPSTCYLDAVYQFYTNLRVEGNLHGGCPPLNGLGGEGHMDAGDLAIETERRLHIWSSVDNASSYAPSPEWMM